MEATFLKRAFGIGEGWEYRSTKYVGSAVELNIRAKREGIRCPKCAADQIALRGTRERRIRTVPIGLKPVTIVAHVPRCLCRKCGEFFDFSPLLPPEGDPTLTALNDLLQDSAE